MTSAVVAALLKVGSNASLSAQAAAGGYEGFAPALSYAPVRDIQRVRFLEFGIRCCLVRMSAISIRWKKPCILCPVDFSAIISKPPSCTLFCFTTYPRPKPLNPKHQRPTSTYRLQSLGLLPPKLQPQNP